LTGFGGLTGLGHALILLILLILSRIGDLQVSRKRFPIMSQDGSRYAEFRMEARNLFYSNTRALEIDVIEGECS